VPTAAYNRQFRRDDSHCCGTNPMNKAFTRENDAAPDDDEDAEHRRPDPHVTPPSG